MQEDCHELETSLSQNKNIGKGPFRWLKGEGSLVTNLDDLNSIPGTHLVNSGKREPTLGNCLLTSTSIPFTHTHT